MDLKRRLAQRRAVDTPIEMQEAPPPPPPPSLDESHAARVARLRSMLDSLISRQQARAHEEAHAPKPEPAKVLLGTERDTPHGKVHVVWDMLEPHHCHGKVSIAKALEARAETIAKFALDRELGGI